MNTIELKNQNIANNNNVAIIAGQTILSDQGTGAKKKRGKSKLKSIGVDPRKCTGCRTCQVRCSIINLGEFNPFKSYLKIIRDHALITTEIVFSDECKNCGLCVSVCNYGALFWEEGKRIKHD